MRRFLLYEKLKELSWETRQSDASVIRGTGNIPLEVFDDWRYGTFQEMRWYIGMLYHTIKQNLQMAHEFGGTKYEMFQS